MAKQLFSNGASATLAVSIINTDVTVQVQAGYGALYPSPTGGDWFLATLEDVNANVEVVKCTGRSGDLLTVVRAQEGTTAQSFTNTVTRVEVRNTKGSMERMLQRSGDTLGGDLELGGFAISGPGSLGADVAVPNTSVFPVGMITLWSGAIGAIPAGWALCNGANGTPDLRDRFVVGAGTSYAVGATGGSVNVSPTTSSDGSHSHNLTIAEHALTTGQIPAHQHQVGYRGSNASTQGADQDFVTDYLDGRLDGYVNTPVGGGNSEAHGHAGSTADAGGTHSHTVSVDTRSPYYALAYIMFTG